MPCRNDCVHILSFRHTKISWATACIIIALVAGCIAFFPQCVLAGATIIPRPDQISDFDARLALARLLSYKKQGLNEALLQYKKLLTQQGQNLDVRLEYGQVLLRCKQHAKAIAQFQIILGKHPDHPDALKGITNAYLGSKRYNDAILLLKSPGVRKKNSPQLMLQLGRAYSASGQYEQAIEIYQALMSGDDHLSHDPDYLIEAAYVQANAGHAVKCRNLFLKAISMMGKQPELNLKFADLMNMWGDFYKIEKIYRNYLDSRPDDFTVQLKLAELLSSTQRYEEAEGLYRILIYKGFPREKLLLALARLKLKEKSFPEARDLLDQFFRQPGMVHINDVWILKAETNDDQTENSGIAAWYHQACFLKAETLYHLKQYGKAYDAYEICANQMPAVKMPEKIKAAIGLGKTALKLNAQEKAKAAFQQAHALNPEHIEAKFYYHFSNDGLDIASKAFMEKLFDPALEPPMGLVQWARLFAVHGLNSQAVFCYETALKKDPEIFPAKLELAELSGIDKQYEQAVKLFKELNIQFPENYKINLGLARVQAWSRAYEDAVETYDSLLSLQPQHPVVRIEQARTKCWAKNMDSAFETYAKLYNPPVDQMLLSNLNELSMVLNNTVVKNRLERLREMVQKDSVYEGYELFFQTPLLPLNRASHLNQRLEEIRIQLLPAYRIQKTAFLERKAKYHAYHLRFLSARNTLSELVAHQPGNQEALFDQAQVDCSLGLCDQEALSYQTLLDLDPLHSIARTALEGNKIRRNPSVRTDYYYSREQGRGELSQIKHQRYDLGLDIPFLCRYHFRIMGHRWQESPLGYHDTYELKGHTFELSGVITPEIQGMLRWTKKYGDGEKFGGTDSGNAHLWLNLKDYLKIGLGFDRLDLFDNDFAIQQETQADAWWFGVTSNPARQLDIGAKGQYLSYSDGNYEKKGELSVGYAFTDHPKIFKTTLKAEYRDTRETNIYQYQGDDLINIIHPYWTPDEYLEGGISFEWYHDLSTLFFCGSQRHFYEIAVSLEQNSDQNPSVELSLKWHLEFNPHWMVNIEGLVHRSGEWDANRFQAAVRYQF
ncbi:tetratricopeptide repeat protein [Desulfobacter curvatus]|uniref:tetratricopeptide repeat protein n=1 Tax=Desulfobacter curvatus TaxID=2290 RepID=UPI0003774196|nr:tetratricopeptide repeat protein [Desulfobacter curvatus]